MAGNLQIFAGKKAYSLIQERGLQPELVEVVAGAAGGPKWLVLNGLDRAIFFSWLISSAKPIYLIGSSIGAWRFAALAQGADAAKAYDRFEQAYLEQRYSIHPSSGEVTAQSKKILETFIDDSGVRKALSHPFFRLNILTVRCRHILSNDNKYILGPGLILTALANTVSRKSLRFFFSRTLVYDPRDVGPFFGMDSFPIQSVPLSQENLRPTLLASGSIPLVMAGEPNLPGAAPGMYRDGGLIDYHLDIPFGGNGIVLFQHYVNRIIPGWFDKLLTWRKPSSANMENVVLLCPSPTFVEKLPYGKVASRTDFKKFISRDQERITYWQKVITAGKILGDEFLELIQSTKINNIIKPLPTSFHK
jgi:hypothetical protein